MRVCSRTAAFVLAWAAFAQTTAGSAEEKLESILRRVGEEADVFARTARQVITEEKLLQISRKPLSRYRSRVPISPEPKAQYQTREVVSEYAFGSLEDSPTVLHEFRRVVSVDGRNLISAANARRTLTLGLRSKDDAVKKRLLEDLAQYGMKDAATDFGQILMMFSARRLRAFRFSVLREQNIAADPAIVLAYREEGESLTVFDGRTSTRRKLEGELWVRKSDYVPLRITVAASRPLGKTKVESEANIDYATSEHGVVLPVSVLHRERLDGQLVTENRFSYSPFRRFAADSELKFEAQ